MPQKAKKNKKSPTKQQETPSSSPSKPTAQPQDIAPLAQPDLRPEAEVSQGSPRPVRKTSAITVEKRSDRVDRARNGSGLSLRKVSQGLQQLSPDAVRLLRELYSLLDSDGTGTVSRDTLKNMMISVGIATDDEMIDEMLSKTGEPVSFAAYLATMSDSVSRLAPREELEDMLNIFRRDDGVIDTNELKELLRAQGLSDAEIEPALERFSRKTPQGRVFDAKAFASVMSV